MKRFGYLATLVLMLVSLFAMAKPTPSLAGGEERVLVEFEPGFGGLVRTALRRAGGTIHYDFETLNAVAVSLPATAVPGIQRNPHVVSVEPDAPRYLMAETTPWGIDQVQALDVQAAGVTGDGITVCIIDSGLYTAHADLQGVNVLGGYGTGWNTDACGHGTHVAGTIAAQANTWGVIGVSPNVSLYIVKVFGDDCGWAYSSTLIDASQRCAAAGADIISMSLGGTKSQRQEQRQFDNLWSQGILSIAAAGNDGNTAYNYPASYSSVVSVAATDVNNAIADFSQQNDQVELAAPGVNVLSTVPWIETNTLTVGNTDYAAAHIEYAAYGTASGALVDGGLCMSSGSWNGKIVLCARGDISFYDKVLAVQNGGGAAAIIYNNEPGGFLGTLGEGFSSDIVALSLSQEDGQALVASSLGANATAASSISKPDSGYEGWDGTSMATPHVSAVAALLWSSDPSLTNSEIRNVMGQTALDLGAAGRDVAFGYGFVQAYDALVALGGGGPVDAPPSVDITSPAAGATVAGTVTVTASASDDNGVTQVAFFANGSAIGVDADAAGGWSVVWDTTAAAEGAATITAIATDTADQTASDSIQVTVDNVPEPNAPPVASFTVACDGLTCAFDASASEDPDGTIVSYVWDFGDGSGGVGVSPNHTYGAAGTYAVALTVTDDEGASDVAGDSVTVAESSGISLSVTGYKSRGVRYADLVWGGAGSASVDIYRDGGAIATTANDGAYTDNLGRLSGTFTYKVCEAGTAICSDEVSVTF